MQQPGNEILPGARLTRDEHGRCAGRDALDQREDGAQRGELREELRVTRRATDARLQMQIVARQHAFLPRAFHQHLDLRHPVRLRQEIVGSQLERADRCFDRPIAGDDNNLGRHGFFPHLAQDFEAVDFRHDDVQQRHVEGVGTQRFERRPTIAHDRHGEASGAHELLENHAKIRLVFGNQYADRRCRIDGAERCRTHDATPDGNVMRKHAPVPSVETSSSCPP